MAIFPYSAILCLPNDEQDKVVFVKKKRSEILGKMFILYLNVSSIPFKKVELYGNIFLSVELTLQFSITF